MNRLATLSTTVVMMFALSACSIQAIDETDERLDQLERDLERETGDPASLMAQGGSVGTVSLFGSLVTETPRGLAPVVGVSFTAGSGKDGKPAPSPKNSPIKLSLEARSVEEQAATSSLGTYTAFGCTDDQLKALVPGNFTANQPTVEDQNTFFVASEMAVFCGAYEVKHLIFLITAKTLVFENATLVSSISGGQVTLTTQELILNGQNRIELLGKDSFAPVLVTPPTLDLSVVRPVTVDEGRSLEILTKGSSWSSQSE